MHSRRLHSCVSSWNSLKVKTHSALSSSAKWRDVINIIFISFSLNLYYVTGGEVYTMLAQTTRFPLNRCRFYGAEITCAFEYLHQVYHNLVLSFLINLSATNNLSRFKTGEYSPCRGWPHQSRRFWPVQISINAWIDDTDILRDTWVSGAWR